MGLLIVGVVVMLALAFLPQLWVRSVIARHAVERPDLVGSGGEFARHILDGMGLHAVRVEETKLGDHYDPDAKAVRLLPQHFHGRSLSAIVIAAHEVGHAMQDATAYPPLTARSKLARQAQRIERVGSIVMLAAPILMLVSKSPHLMVAQVFFGLSILAATVLVHLVTLPVEFDASFKRAMPVLESGRYIPDRDLGSARSILRAAAFTYVAAAGLSLLDVMRWFRALRM